MPALRTRIFPMWILLPIHLRQCAGLRQFVLRMLAQPFAVKVLVAIAIVLAIPNLPATDHSAKLGDPLFAFIVIVLLAPIIETLLLQALPIETCRATRKAKW